VEKNLTTSDFLTKKTTTTVKPQLTQPTSQATAHTDRGSSCMMDITTTTQDTATTPLLPLDGPSFDVDESVAALVLQHVENPLDRFALAGATRVWRVAATTTSPTNCLWPKHARRLKLQGALALKLTDWRLARLLKYAGPLCSIEIRGAPSAFTGYGIYPHYRQMAKESPTASSTVALSGCPGVEVAFLLDLRRIAPEWTTSHRRSGQAPRGVSSFVCERERLW
jgi:hypothetical protein